MWVPPRARSASPCRLSGPVACALPRERTGGCTMEGEGAKVTLFEWVPWVGECLSLGIERVGMAQSDTMGRLRVTR